MMKKDGKILLMALAALLLSACTLTHPPAYDLPSADGLTPGREITVGAGENLYAVAQKYNVRMRDLIVVNKMESPYRVRPGQRLYLPVRDGYAAPTPRAAPLAPIDKGGLGPSSPQIGNDSVTAVPLEAPVPAATPAASPAPQTNAVPLTPPQIVSTPAAAAKPAVNPLTVTETPPSTPAAAAPAKIGNSNLTTQTKARSVTEVPEIDIENLHEELRKEEEQRKTETAAPAPETPVAEAQPMAFAWPVRGTIISPFGPNGKGRDNDGINIAAPKGAPVKAAADGTVAYAGSEMKGFGNLVLVRHANGWVTAYAHLDRMVISKDAAVKAGEMIGTVGSTGGVGSPQLHFEVRRDGKPVDPELMLK